jgi:hypothetical protein
MFNFIQGWFAKLRRWWRGIPEEELEELDPRQAIDYRCEKYHRF